MKKILTGLALTACVAFFSGCATRGEVKGFMVQLDNLKSENAELQKKVDRLDSLMIEQQKLIRSAKAEQNSSLGQMEVSMQRIVGILQDSGFQVSKLDERIESLRREIVQPPTVNDTMPVDSTDTTQIIEEDPQANLKQIYDTAVLDHRKGDYDLAVMGYDQFLQELGEEQSDWADDAYYGIAECFFAQEKDNEAIKVYQQLITKFPQSDLMPVANFKKGLLYERNNKLDLATIVFTNIVKKYPHSTEANLAKDRLSRLNEKN